MTACIDPPRTLSALPTPLDLALYAGDDFRLDLHVKDQLTGQDADLTGYVATASIRATRGDVTALATFAATIDGSVVHLHLAGADTATLPTPAVWDCQLAGTDVTTLATGRVGILGEVTRP
jgi:hypothetical protein